MTSANVIEYNIYDKEGKNVGHHRQNLMCMICNDGLEQFTPAEDFKIQAYGYDEEADMWEDDKLINLAVWLTKNKGEYTHKRFGEGDYIILKRKGGEGTVKSVIKGNFVNSYNVEFPDGEIKVINQNQIQPEL